MTMRMSARAKFFLYLFLIFMVILTVIPLLYTVSASFKTNMEIATGGINLIPKTFTFDNYKTVWGMSGTGIASKVTYTDYTINSIKVSLMTVVLVVLFTSMSAYCFQRGNFPGRKFLYWLFMATMFIGAGTVTMFPLLRITTKLGLNNLPGLALVQFGTAGASDLFLTMGYLKTISKELDDAAKIDLLHLVARDSAAVQADPCDSRADDVPCLVEQLPASEPDARQRSGCHHPRGRGREAAVLRRRRREPV